MTYVALKGEHVDVYRSLKQPSSDTKH